MQHITEFLLTLFWVTFFIMFFNLNNFAVLLIFSEILWCILYLLCVLLGLFTDNLTLMSLSLFVLVFASIEFIIGLFLIMLYRYTQTDSFIFTNKKSYRTLNNLFSLKKLYFNYIKF